MTLDEYRKQVFDEIRHSASSQSAKDKVNEANNILVESKISDVNKRQFWTQLYKDLENANLYVTEKQSATSLSAIVAAAQAVIATHLNSIKQ